MRHHILSATLLTAALLLAGCSRTPKYAYVKDAPRDTEMAITTNFSSVIQPNDQLYIFVYSENDEAAKPFNEETNKKISTTDIAYNRERSAVKGYLVSQSGDIIFPLLGKLHVAGLSLDSLGRSIEKLLKDGNYVTDAIVSVSLMNFYVTVIGEVTHPDQVFAVGNRLTIFEAIARCGDITMDGIRSCVVVVRTQGDKQVIDTLDLTSKTLFDSPYYYLQQHDIVYVEPTEKKKRTAYRNEDWPKYMTTGIAALRLAYTLIYRYTSDAFKSKLKN